MDYSLINSADILYFLLCARCCSRYWVSKTGRVPVFMELMLCCWELSNKRVNRLFQVIISARQKMKQIMGYRVSDQGMHEGLFQLTW